MIGLTHAHLSAGWLAIRNLSQEHIAIVTSIDIASTADRLGNGVIPTSDDRFADPIQTGEVRRTNANLLAISSHALQLNDLI